MTQRPDPETSSFSSNPDELQELVSRVATLVQMSLDMTRIVVDVQHRLPIVLARQVDEALQGIPQLVADRVAALAPSATTGSSASESPAFVRGVPITPADLELLHPPGVGDDASWHVVLVGREPGLFLSVTASNASANGVPNASRRKKDTRAEALTYYRINYEAQKVEKWIPIAPETSTA
ncbi:hypothetical protein C8J57DRAFT_1240582 [Mycena rebaudengoi]|nr:hypothetical protein C8J57DRAFT_1522602 [Mycena rebaudengoi]KAJ7248073.1 hypothetical protein C8J57DRAFT_1240582 [Mycena rebaudengoi]